MHFSRLSAPTMKPFAKLGKGIIAMSALQKVPTGKGSNWVEIVGFD